MKSIIYFSVRILISIGLLTGIVFYVSPVTLLDSIKSLDAKCLSFAVILMPFFLCCRMGKWYVLLRQVVNSAQIPHVITSYLKGMAFGMFTPARAGEVTRILYNEEKTSQFYLFITEKIIEVICLCVLTLFAVFKLQIFKNEITAVSVVLILFLTVGLKMVKKISIKLLNKFSRKNSSQKAGIESHLKRTKIGGCVTLSFACFFIFMLQVYCLILGFGENVSIDIILFFPVILFSNLAPITIGGFGLRESMAVLILGPQNVPAAVAMGSFFIVTIIDLLIPAFFGIFIFAFQNGFGIKSKNRVEPTTKKKDDGDWNEFWEDRKSKRLGRLISHVRKYHVTPVLADFVIKNTEPGTLIEAGCGTAEVTITIAKKRGDRIILVDMSEKALMQAERNAEKARIPAKLINCDIKKLYDKTGFISDGSVFNIGVIEHFKDCTPILHQMSAVSGNAALAVIPKRSLFWRLFISISIFIKLVPENFYIHLFTEKELRETAEKAGLKVIKINSVRIFGIIPYTGMKFSQHHDMRQVVQDIKQTI